MVSHDSRPWRGRVVLPRSPLFLSYSPEWLPQPWETGGHAGLGSSTRQPLQSPGKVLKNADLQAPPQTYRIRISRWWAAIPQL